MSFRFLYRIYFVHQSISWSHVWFRKIKIKTAEYFEDIFSWISIKLNEDLFCKFLFFLLHRSSLNRFTDQIFGETTGNIMNSIYQMSRKKIINKWKLFVQKRQTTLTLHFWICFQSINIAWQHLENFHQCVAEFEHLNKPLKRI